LLIFRRSAKKHAKCSTLRTSPINGIFPKVIELMLFSLPVITAAHLITPTINALFHVMRPKSLRPRRHVLSLSKKGVVVVALVVVVIVVAKGEVKAVIVPILGTNGVPMTAPKILKMTNLQLMESRRKTERG
jgi:hypothetical protein